MKRLLGLAVLFAILFMCAPSYGYFLVYNISATVKGVDYGYAQGVVSIPLKGYVLVTLNDSDGFVDANLVLYGTNSTGEKVYVELNLNGNEYLDDTETWADYGYAFVYIEGRDASYFDWDGQVFGKTALKDIGLGSASKKNVAGSLKGAINVWEGMLLDTRQDIIGTASVSMSLNSSYTKAVNDNDPSWTKEEILEGQIVSGKLRGIKPDLEAKHYVNATP
jgi:hypothetical protein